MFEAKLTEGMFLKKIVESIKDIVNDVNIDISPTGKCATSFCCLKVINCNRYCSPSYGQLPCSSSLPQPDPGWI